MQKWIMLLLVVFVPSLADAQSITTGTYNVTGGVVSSSPSNGANCIDPGATIQGFSYFPGSQGGGKNFTVAINPQGPHSLIVHFPQLIPLDIGQGWTDTADIVLPPSTVNSKGSFSLVLKEASAKSFTAKVTVTFNGPNQGSCTETYHLVFKKGIPAIL
jgi:hypothetical protein